MGNITLNSGFTVMPEGTYLFKIESVEYKENFGKLTIKMQTSNGYTHYERFTLLDTKGATNEKALSAFSYFARIAMNDMELQNIDPEKLVGRYMECDVEHEKVPSRDNPSKIMTFTRLRDKRPVEAGPAPETAASVTTPPDDLDAILGL